MGGCCDDFETNSTVHRRSQRSESERVLSLMNYWMHARVSVFSSSRCCWMWDFFFSSSHITFGSFIYIRFFFAARFKSLFYTRMSVSSSFARRFFVKKFSQSRFELLLFSAHFTVHTRSMLVCFSFSLSLSPSASSQRQIAHSTACIGLESRDFIYHITSGVCWVIFV